MFFLPVMDLIYGVDRCLVKQRLTHLLQETKCEVPKYLSANEMSGGCTGTALDFN